MVKKYGSTIAFFLIACCSALAQGDFRSGYVITNEGDSITGYIKYGTKKQNSRFCYFRKEKKSDVIKYKAEEIAVYAMYGDKRFETRQLKSDNGRPSTVFVETIVQGKMSLYRFGETFYIDTGGDLILLPKKEQKIIETSDGKKMHTSNEYVLILNQFLADCSLNANQISYGESALTSIVKNYNRCKGSQSLHFKTEKQSTKVNAQIFAGLDNSSLEIEGVEGAFKTDRSALLGLGLEFSAPRLTDKVAFSLEMIFSKKNYLGYYERSSGQTITRTDYDMHVSFVKIPVGFRYNFSEPINTAYIKGGLVFFFPGESSLKVLSEEDNDGTVSTFYDSFNFKAKRSTGYWAGVGYTHLIVPHVGGFVELRIERTNGFVGEDFVDSISTTTNINLIIGVRF